MVTGLRVVVVVLAGAGCATTGGRGATSLGEQRFPARAEVQQVALRAPKLDLTKHGAVVVGGWTLSGPFPAEASVVHLAPSTPWERALAQASPRLGAALSSDLQCVAREVARFAHARAGYPGQSLRHFMQRRCGTTATDVALTSLSGEVPAATSEEAWLTQWRPQLAAMSAAAGPATLAGLGVHREGSLAVVVLATATPAAVFSRPVPLTPRGHLEVRGRATSGGLERIEALINQGALGVVACRTLDAVTPPEFAFDCPVSAADARTTLSIAGFEPGRLLGRALGAFRLWPAGAPEATWSPPPGAGEVPADQFNARFVEQVNTLRTRAGLPALTEVAPQSATAAALAPHYFAAVLGDAEPLDAEEIALGMMAGWDVAQPLVSAGFGSEWVAGTRELSVFLEFVLDEPFTRKALTEPRATLVAVGAVQGAGASLAAIFSTYVPLGRFTRKEAEIAVVTRLNQLRLDRHLGLAQWTLWPEDEGAVIERNLASGRWTPREGLDYALEKTVGVLRGRGQVRGYVQLVDDLEHFQFPPEVLQRPDINVFVTVGVYRAERWPQARYVVCFVLARAEDIETASR